MVPEYSTVGGLLAAVAAGLVSREDAIVLLTDAGFADADKIVADFGLR